MDEDEWLQSLGAGRVAGNTLRGVIAVAVAETLHHLLHGPKGSRKDLPWDFTKAERHMQEKILTGRELPKYDEVDFLLKHPKSAPLLGSRLLLGFLRYVRAAPRASGVTRVVAHGIPMTAHASMTVAPALDRDGAAAAAQQLLQVLMRSSAEEAGGGQLGQRSLLLGGGDHSYEVKPLTLRDMVRAVVPADGSPIANADIRHAVATKFAAAAPQDRQIDQTIVGLRRDGELRQVSHGVQAATDKFAHAPYPTDPTRKRARS